jgi:hypothetical protein
MHLLPQTAVVRCLSCNLVDSWWEIDLDSTGRGKIQINETNSLVSARLRVTANRCDTAVMLKQRSPKDAQAFYHLTQPLVGRVMLIQLGILYADSLQSRVASHADPGDELNIFGELRDFYLVHDPMYSTPLYLLKRSALRLN